MMKKRQYLILFFLFIFSNALFARAITDDLGHTLLLKQPAQRIISLAPDVTETLFAIGAGAQIIGVMSGSDYPSAARNLPLIGSYSGIDLEKIVALHPDLIVVWSNTFARQIAVLKKMGIPVYVTQPQQLEDIPRTMKNLGYLTGTEKQANVVAEKFSQRLSMLQKQYQQQKPISVFYQLGPYSLFTINKQSWINQVITLCGGRNIFAEAKTIAPEVSWEAVITAHPDVVINSSTNDAWKKRWLVWKSIPAVKKGALFTVNPDLIDRAGPRLLDGMETVCQALQRTRSG